VIVEGDPERLEQVVRHLVDNAVKFTPPDGQVVVQTMQDGQQARVVVRDTGIGMTPDVVSRVFQRFWQHDSSSTREFGGLGLGLTLVDELVKLHGGSVRAESPGAGFGSRFTVQLPVRGGAGQSAS
jgi:signal transduction histidine kinase